MICSLLVTLLFSLSPLGLVRAAIPFSITLLSLYAENLDSIHASGQSRIVHKTQSSSTELSYEGKISFTDDEKDIKSISPGGYFRFSKSTFGNRRAVHIESRSDGTLKRTYYVGKQEVAYEPEGSKWLADMLPEIIATSGIGAEDRVARIFHKAGTKGVLKEISKIDSDYTKNIYFSHLLAQTGLSETDLQAIVSQVRTEVSSDYEKGKLLRKVSVPYLRNEKIAKDYLTSVASISSDYEKAKVLRHVLAVTSLSETTHAQALQTAAGISSDYEKAKLLVGWLCRPDLSNQNFQQGLAVADQLNSDHERAKVLTTAVSRNPKKVGDNYDPYMAAVANISSDYEKSKVLLHLLANAKKTEKILLPYIRTAETISSDYEKAKVLLKVGQLMPKDSPLLTEAYKKAAKGISSDYEYRKVMVYVTE